MVQFNVYSIYLLYMLYTSQDGACGFLRGQRQPRRHVSESASEPAEQYAEPRADIVCMTVVWFLWSECSFKVMLFCIEQLST